jgi:hypothetical protein
MGGESPLTLDFRFESTYSNLKKHHKHVKPRYCSSAHMEGKDEMSTQQRLFSDLCFEAQAA